MVTDPPVAGTGSGGTSGPTASRPVESLTVALTNLLTKSSP